MIFLPECLCKCPCICLEDRCACSKECADRNGKQQSYTIGMAEHLENFYGEVSEKAFNECAADQRRSEKKKKKKKKKKEEVGEEDEKEKVIDYNFTTEEIEDMSKSTFEGFVEDVKIGASRRIGENLVDSVVPILSTIAGAVLKNIMRELATAKVVKRGE